MLPAHHDPAHLLVLYGLAVLAFGILERRRLAAVMARVGRPAGYFVAISVVMLLSSQAWSPGRLLFPWTSWAMYTARNPAPAPVRVIAVRESGASAPLVLRESVKGPNPRPLMGHLYRRARGLETTDPDRRGRVEWELRTILSGVARLDRQVNPQDPIQRIEFEECLLEGPPPWDSASLVCRPTPWRWVAAMDPIDAR